MNFLVEPMAINILDECQCYGRGNLTECGCNYKFCGCHNYCGEYDPCSDYLCGGYMTR